MFCGGVPILTSPKYDKSRKGLPGTTSSSRGTDPSPRFSIFVADIFTSGILISSEPLTRLIDNIHVENHSHMVW